MQIRCITGLTVAAALVCVSIAEAQAIVAAPDIRVCEFAGPDLVPNAFTVTVDPCGHPTVAGPGYVAVLFDGDNDGRADRRVVFAERPSDGAHGLLWVGKQLYVTGDGGIWRFEDCDGDHVADGPPTLLMQLKTGGEHDAHGIRQGPDGHFYIVCGNYTGDPRGPRRSAGSPVKEKIAGFILRVSPDWATYEVFAHGFRNPYDLAFNAHGELFTFDSDNERCISLPWYEPTRIYHVLPGGFYGWLSPQRAYFWRYPPWFPDVIPPVATAGRGSPTGVESAEPLRWAGIGAEDLLVADWTFGRVLHVDLSPGLAGYRARVRVLMRAGEGAGWAPTDLAADRQGCLWVTTGGRGTRGALFRVWSERRVEAEPVPRPRKLEVLHRLCRGDIADAGAVQDEWLRRARLIGMGAVETAGDDPVSILANARNGKPIPPERLAALLQRGGPRWQRRWLLRAAQALLGGPVDPRSVGHVWEGYSVEARHESPSRRLARAVLPLVADEDRAVRWEAIRWLAMARGGGVETEAARLLLQGADRVDALELTHRLIAVSRFPSTARQLHVEQLARLLVALPYRLDAERRERDRHWPERLYELFDALADGLPTLDDLIVQQAGFGHLDHAVYLRSSRFGAIEPAVKVFLARWRKGDLGPWPGALVEPLRRLEPQTRRMVVKELWQAEPRLRDALLPVAALDAEAYPLDWFVKALGSTQPATVAVAARVLAARGASPPNDALEGIRRAWLAARRNGNRQLAQQLQGYFRRWAGVEPSGAERADAADMVWRRWRERLKGAPWQEGDADRGKVLFHRLGCAACHQGPSMVGPSLRGVARRFGREELFRAIVQPNFEVPDRYAATVFQLRDGRIVTGIVVYEAAQVILVHRADGTTVRLRPDDVERRQRSGVSIMPTGLLNGLSDSELADLYAYLLTL